MSPIVFLCDTLEGGASGSTARMYGQLQATGLPLERWHFTPRRSGPARDGDVGLEPEPKRPPLERALKNISRSLADRMRQRRHEQIFLDRLGQTPPSLINIRNIHTCGLNHDSLLRIPASIPLVWTLHDAWPVVPHAFQWIDERHGQPDHAVLERDPARAQLRRTRFFDSRRDTVLVSPSRWLHQLSREQFPHLRCEHIPNGVDPDVFVPVGKSDAKRALQLDSRRLWIGTASTWANVRKGPDILFEAVAQMTDTPLGVLVWGGRPEYALPDHCELRYLGRLNAEEDLRMAYSACDLFCCPSRADNLPNTVLESLSCQTPVIGTPVGGIPDMIETGATGWLMEQTHAAACARALRHAIGQKAEWPQIQRQARKKIMETFHVQLTAERYKNLFLEIIRAKQ